MRNKKTFQRLIRAVALVFIVLFLFLPGCRRDPAAVKIFIKGFADNYINIYSTVTSPDGKLAAVGGSFAVSFMKPDSSELIRTVPVGFRPDELRFFDQGRFLGVFLKNDLQFYIETTSGKRVEKAGIQPMLDPKGPVMAAFDDSRRRPQPPQPGTLGFFIYQHVNRAAVVPEHGVLLVETEGYYRERMLGQPTPQVMSLDLQSFFAERRNGICTLSLGENRCAVVEGFIGMEGLVNMIFVRDEGAGEYILAKEPRPEGDYSVRDDDFDFLPDEGILCLLEYADNKCYFSLYRGRNGKAEHLRDVPIRDGLSRGYGLIHRADALAMTYQDRAYSWKLLYAVFTGRGDTIELFPIKPASEGYYRAVDIYPRRKIVALSVASLELPLESSIVLIDIVKKKILKEFPECFYARVNQDETLLACAGKTLMLYDAADWSKIREFEIAPFMVNSVFFSPDKKYLGVCTKDSCVVFYEMATGSIALTIVFTNEGEAIAYTEDNFFAATPNAKRFVGFYVGNEPVHDQSLFDTFYQPEKIKAVLSGIANSFSVN